MCTSTHALPETAGGQSKQEKVYEFIRTRSVPCVTQILICSINLCTNTLTCQTLMALGFWGLRNRFVKSTAALPAACETKGARGAGKKARS